MPPVNAFTPGTSVWPTKSQPISTAQTAPTTCAIQYAIMSPYESFPLSATPRETPGL
jgi:hypothetical protein